MKKTISEIESIIEDRIAELEEEYELDIFDRNDIREEEYRKGGWKHDPFPEELEEEEDEEEEWHYMSLEQQLYEVGGEQQYKYGLYFGYEEKTVGTVLKNTWYTALDFARLVWMSLGDLVSGLVSVNDMSGPVGVVSAIAQTGQGAATTADGILNVLYLGAFIAINLAVMNMLPLPALDGGRVFLLLVNTVFTAITKKKIPSKFEGYIHAAGMILLLAFMAFITFKDIWKLVQ